jgi:hypothetical protein
MRNNRPRESDMKQCWVCKRWKGPSLFIPKTATCMKCCPGTEAEKIPKRVRCCLRCHRSFTSFQDMRICGPCKEHPDWKDGEDAF